CQRDDLCSADLGAIRQKRPCRFIEEIELAIVSATRATKAKVRITTTTECSLLEHGMEGQ
ncbi:MAG: hypothetical protein WBE13_14765, partial [Candidatus Acidiferrum sp.]